MEKYFKKIWKAIARGIFMTINSAWYAIIAAIIGFIVGWIWGAIAGAITFFGIIGIVISYIWFRQLYWWFSGKVDYVDGGFPKLWKKIVGK